MGIVVVVYGKIEIVTGFSTFACVSLRYIKHCGGEGVGIMVEVCGKICGNILWYNLW